MNKTSGEAIKGSAYGKQVSDPHPKTGNAPPSRGLY